MRDDKLAMDALAAARDAATERAEKAGAGLSKISAAIGTVRFMDPPDGGDVSLAEQVHRMRAALDEAEARVAALEGALRQADCPHSIQGDDGTVGDCVAKGHCGCCLGEPLKDAALSAPPTPAVVHASDCAVHNAPALPPGPCNCGADPAVSQAAADVLADAERYRWLRARDLDTIHKGGVFAGMTPDNVVLNGEDLDNAVDAARLEPAEREG